MNSQNDEEKVILEYFDSYTGYFADLGANDGQTFSNTFALAWRGWSGLLIEPSPTAFKKLEKLYSSYNKYNLINSAVWNKDGKITLHDSGSLLNKEDHSLVSTLKESEKNRFKKVVDYSIIDVKCMTWESILELSVFKEFDFISIDIEGCELDVLPQIDLSKTRLICIEWNGKEDLKKEYEKYLSGFNLIHVTGENLIYGRQ